MLVAASETIYSLIKFEKILCVYFLISRSSKRVFLIPYRERKINNRVDLNKQKD